VIALLTDARTDRVEVAIDKTGTLGMLTCSSTALEQRSQKSRRQASRNSPHDRHRPPAARSSRCWLAFEHMNEGGRIVGGCCVDKRAMAPILESYGRQRRDQNVRERFPASSDNQNELFAMTIAASDSNQAQIYNQNQ
jgi:hypothetical protein